MEEPLPVLLLPGMDGTGVLFKPLLREITSEFEPIVVSLPEFVSYGELLNAIQSKVPASGTFAVVAESFSGPLALTLALSHRDRISALILCNSFVVPPRTTLLRFLPWGLIFSLAPPRLLIKRYLLGRHAPEELVTAVTRAVRSVKPDTLAGRFVQFSPRATPLS